MEARGGGEVPGRGSEPRLTARPPGPPPAVPPGLCPQLQQVDVPAPRAVPAAGGHRLPRARRPRGPPGQGGAGAGEYPSRCPTQDRFGGAGGAGSLRGRAGGEFLGVPGSRCSVRMGRPALSVPLQVADERFCPDVLSTVKEMSVANFRRVPKMPIYGTAQPSSKVRSTHPAQGRATPQSAVPSPRPPFPLDPRERAAVPDGREEEALAHPVGQPAGGGGAGGERAGLHAQGAGEPRRARPRARLHAGAAGGEPGVLGCLILPRGRRDEGRVDKGCTRTLGDAPQRCFWLCC